MSPTSIFSQLADYYDPSKSYVTRPVQWAEEKAKLYLWKAQREIMESVRDNRYTAVPSCHNAGKSLVAATAVAHWIDSHPPGEAFVVSTAPTAAQVSAILWREIAKTHTRAQLPGRINRAGFPQWFIGTGLDGLVGYGRKPADYTESAFQGIHARFVLIVVDEACGIQKTLFDAVDALATNENARVLAIGNPDDPGSHFASVTKPGSGWNTIQIDGLRTPNMTKEIIIGDNPQEPKFPLIAALMKAENIPFNTEPIPAQLREYMLSALWVEERIRRWAGLGETAHLDYAPDELAELVQRRCSSSPLFTAKVRGVFPDKNSDGVIPLGWVQLAMNRWADWDDAKRPEPPGRRKVGVDVAYGGEDETAIAVSQGVVCQSIHRYRNADTEETAKSAAGFLNHPQAMAIVDVIGIGAGVYDQLRKYAREGIITANIIPFNAARKSVRWDVTGEFKFANDRAAAWWHLREMLDPSRGTTACLPNDERLLEELTTVKYVVKPGGVIQIESKDEIRKRLGRSTDTADAVIQSFWVEGAPAGVDDGIVPWSSRGNDVQRYGGYDPFTDSDMAGTGRFGGSGADPLDDWVNS